MISIYGYHQALNRIKNHTLKFTGKTWNGLPIGLNKKDTIHALKSIVKNAEKAIEYLEQEKNQ